MAKKKRPKKSSKGASIEKRTVELRVPAAVFDLAMEIKDEDAEALRSILISILGSDALFGIDTVVLTCSEEDRGDGKVRTAYQKSC
jgi:hypothetical protein